MATHKRIILFPLPFQGHINPMLQLANILHAQGTFKITIIHTEYNSPNESNYPHFTFKSIKDNFSDIINQFAWNPDSSFYLKYLNTSCVDPFRDCLAGLLGEADKEPVACVITDAGFYFTQAVANELKIPRMVLRTSSLGCVLAYSVLPFHSKKDCFKLTKEGLSSLYHQSIQESRHQFIVIASGRFRVCVVCAEKEEEEEERFCSFHLVLFSSFSKVESNDIVVMVIFELVVALEV